MAKKGEKLKVIKTISTIEGTLYENEIVKFEQKEDGHYHVKDTMGKIWYVDKNNLSKIKYQLLRGINRLICNI